MSEEFVINMAVMIIMMMVGEGKGQLCTVILHSYVLCTFSPSHDLKFIGFTFEKEQEARASKFNKISRSINSSTL